LLFVFCSAFIHFSLMIILPDFLENDSGLIPIQLLPSRDVQLDISPETRVERFAQMDERRGEPAPKKLPVDAMMLNKKMEELSLGERLRVPSPDVLLPPIEKNASREERIRRVVASPSYEWIAKAFEESRKPKGGYRGTTYSIDVSPDILKKKRVEIDPETELVLMRLRSIEGEEFRDRQEDGK